MRFALGGEAYRNLSRWIGTVEASRIEDEQGHAQPWWQFRDDKMKPPSTLTLPDVEKEWLDAINDPSREAIFRRGEWCLPRFCGVVIKRRRRVGVETSVDRSKQIESTQDLSDTLLSAMKVLDQFQAGVVMPSNPVDAAKIPQSDRAQSESTVYQQPLNIVATLAGKDVTPPHFRPFVMDGSTFSRMRDRPLRGHHDRSENAGSATPRPPR